MQEKSNGQTLQTSRMGKLRTIRGNEEEKRGKERANERLVMESNDNSRKGDQYKWMNTITGAINK